MKLEGIKVIDLSLLLPGPHLTATMADHGAEVIKIESYQAGEPSRGIGPYQGDHSAFFRTTHRGKKSLRLNLKHPDGLEVLLRLAETADVLLEGFRPGVADRLGIGYAAVSARAPHLVYCSLSAFGQSGAYRDKPAHDLAVMALAGLASLNLGQDGNPAMPALPVSDMAASQMALCGILMALLRRQTTGTGDYIDVSMHDALLACTPSFAGRVFAQTEAAKPQDDRIWGGQAFYNLYETQDHEWIALAGAEHKFVDNFLTKAGRPDLARYAAEPAGMQEPLKQWLRTTFKSEPLAQWLDWLHGMDVCYAPVRSLKAALEDSHTSERGMVVEDEHGYRQLGVPIKFSNEPARPRLTPPGFGEHSNQILADLGYLPEEVQRLRTQSVI